MDILSVLSSVSFLFLPWSFIPAFVVVDYTPEGHHHPDDLVDHLSQPWINEAAFSSTAKEGGACLIPV